MASAFMIYNTSETMCRNRVSVSPFLCFECAKPECAKPKENMLNIHRLYKNKIEAQERIKKIKELEYKNVSAIDLGDSGIRIQEIWCHDCILNWISKQS
jgi:hypothetical protein